MNFLGCDGIWLLQADGSTVCQGHLKTYTVQEMKAQFMPSMTMQQKAEFTGAAIGLLALVWVGKKLMNIPR